MNPLYTHLLFLLAGYVLGRLGRAIYINNHGWQYCHTKPEEKR